MHGPFPYLRDDGVNIPITVSGAGGSADELRKVAGAEQAVGDAARDTTGPIDEATRATGQHEKSLGSNARAMQHTADSARAVGDVMRGDFASGLIDGTRALHGLTELLASNPFLLMALGLPLVIDIFEKIKGAMVGTEEEIKKREEEVAKNTEQMGDRMAKALEHPGQTQWAEKFIADAMRADDAMQTLVGTLEKVYKAQDDINKANVQNILSGINADEVQDTKTAQQRGATPLQLQGIKLRYQQLRDKFTAQGKTDEAQSQVDSTARLLSNLQDQLDEAFGEALTAQGDIQARHANSQKTYESIIASIQRQIADSEARQKYAHNLWRGKDENGGELNQFNYTSEQADLAQRYWAEIAPQEEANRKALQDRLKEVSKSHEAAVNAPPKPEDVQKQEALEDRIHKLEIEIDAAKGELQAAQINQEVVARDNSTTAVKGLASADSQWLQALVEQAVQRMGKGLTTAKKDPRYSAVSEDLAKALAAATTSQRDPTPENMTEFIAAIRILGEHIRQSESSKHELSAGLGRALAEIQKLNSQFQNSRDRGP